MGTLEAEVLSSLVFSIHQRGFGDAAEKLPVAERPKANTHPFFSFSRCRSSSWQKKSANLCSAFISRTSYATRDPHTPPRLRRLSATMHGSFRLYGIGSSRSEWSPPSSCGGWLACATTANNSPSSAICNNFRLLYCVFAFSN
ncbi:uncharacterized protein LOC122313361 isoform X2 [Carya illinoinensis]|uniref:uncharacterized protein LOC122313361 isoform X2 n=1 Tax=Carya illinoinensis TaxID=32201 RepID=UPI001C72554F|nr:uncharacterized protein LOC122313361 isoform X2 [Carya illinoinensis]